MHHACSRLPRTRITYLRNAMCKVTFGGLESGCELAGGDAWVDTCNWILEDAVEPVKPHLEEPLLEPHSPIQSPAKQDQEQAQEMTQCLHG